MAYNSRLRKGVMLIVALAFLTIFSLNGAASGINQTQSQFGKLRLGIIDAGSIAYQFEVLPFPIDRISICRTVVEEALAFPKKETSLPVSTRFVIKVPSIPGTMDLHRFIDSSENDGADWRGYRIVINRAFPESLTQITRVSGFQQIGAINGNAEVSAILGKPIEIQLADTINDDYGSFVLISPVSCKAKEFGIEGLPGFAARISDVAGSNAQIVSVEPAIGFVLRANIWDEPPRIAPSPELTRIDKRFGGAPQTIASDTAEDSSTVPDDVEIETASAHSEINGDLTNPVTETSPEYVDLISLTAEVSDLTNSSVIAKRKGIQLRIEKANSWNTANKNAGIDKSPREPETIVGDSPIDSQYPPFVPLDSVRDKLIVNSVQSNERQRVHSQTQRKIAEISFALKPLTQSCTAFEIGGTNDPYGLPHQPRAPADDRSYA